MAESTGDKTEAPTPRRRQEAREQGNIARSHDLTSSVLLIGSLFLMKWFGPKVILTLRDVVGQQLSGAAMSNLNAQATGEQIVHCLAKVSIAVAPLLGGAAFIVIVANVAQVGFNFSPQRLALNFCRAQPHPRLEQDVQLQPGRTATAHESAQGRAGRTSGLVGHQRPAGTNHRRSAAFLPPDFRPRGRPGLFHRHPRRRAAVGAGHHRLRLPAVPRRAGAAHDQAGSEGRDAQHGRRSDHRSSAAGRSPSSGP